MRVLTEADGMALASLRQAWSTKMKAQQKLNETGMFFRTPLGYVQHNALISIANSAMEIGEQFRREVSNGRRSQFITKLRTLVSGACTTDVHMRRTHRRVGLPDQRINVGRSHRNECPNCG